MIMMMIIVLYVKSGMNRTSMIMTMHMSTLMATFDDDKGRKVHVGN